MIDSHEPLNKNPFSIRIILHLIIPILFLLLIVIFYPGRTAFQLDGDEGLELMRAMLVDKGYLLYDEIWSDHPPLLAYLLAGGFRLVGYKVGFSRLIILGFSLLLIWASGRINKLIWGTRVSLISQVLIIFLPLYLSSSITIMTGLPSLALGTISLWVLIEWHHSRKYHWLVLSGLFLSASVLIKISLAFLGPIFCLGLLIGEYTYADKQLRFSVLLSPVVFGLVFSATLTGVAIFGIGVENLSQLIAPHTAAYNLEGLGSSINNYLLDAWPYIVLAAIGVYEAILAQKWSLLYPLAWAITAYLLLVNHTPVWNHHQLNITIPLALLSAPAADHVFQKFKAAFSNKSSNNLPNAFQIIALLSLLAVVFKIRLPETIELLTPIPTFLQNNQLDKRDEMILAHMGVYKEQTNWVVTDMPIYAFRSRLLVPPELAYWSQKALATGEITESEIIRIISRYQPEQVLLWRFYLPEVNEYLADNYDPIYTIGDKRLWIRNNIMRIPLQ